jgi:hypothetical protein
VAARRRILGQAPDPVPGGDVVGGVEVGIVVLAGGEDGAVVGTGLAHHLARAVEGPSRGAPGADERDFAALLGPARLDLLDQAR